MNQRLKHGAGGFSLVEVVIAIGILSFALLAIVGLLPTGLKSVRNANEQAGAANVLESIAEAIRSASITNTNSFDSAAFTWSYGGSVYSNTIGSGITKNMTIANLTLEGTVTNSLNKRLVAYVSVTPPSTITTPGNALISVAWTASPNPVWKPETSSWSNVEGSLTTGIQFLPRVTSAP